MGARDSETGQFVSSGNASQTDGFISRPSRLPDLPAGFDGFIHQKAVFEIQFAAPNFDGTDRHVRAPNPAEVVPAEEEEWDGLDRLELVTLDAQPASLRFSNPGQQQDSSQAAFEGGIFHGSGIPVEQREEVTQDGVLGDGSDAGGQVTNILKTQEPGGRLLHQATAIVGNNPVVDSTSGTGAGGSNGENGGGRLFSHFVKEYGSGPILDPTEDRLRASGNVNVNNVNQTGLVAVVPAKLTFAHHRLESSGFVSAGAD